MLHLWPSVTPAGIWLLPYDLWCEMAAVAPQWLELSLLRTPLVTPPLI